MAPDRGHHPLPSDEDANDPEELRQHRSNAGRFMADPASEGQNFTIRGILVGLGVGLIICFSNMYFGLQTGWISSMSMPSSLIGFAFFKTFARQLDLPFTPVENVLVQTVAGSMGTMPLGCGFVGVMPALNYLLQPEEQGPLFLSLWKLILWALGLCFFGVVFAVPLRRQVIIREKLKFPSGTATALMIGVLHGKETASNDTNNEMSRQTRNPNQIVEPPVEDSELEGHTQISRSSWKSKVKLLVISFAISGLYTLATYFFPILRNLPVFGFALAENWLWTLNPSFAYVGQGIIMGPATTTHMLLGAVIGWGILSPLAKSRGWAPGNVNDWETGSKGWIVWVSLAIMLADSVVSLGYIALRPIVLQGPEFIRVAYKQLRKQDWNGLIQQVNGNSTKGYAAIAGREDESTAFEEARSTENSAPTNSEIKDLPEPDAPPEHLVSNRTVCIGLILSVLFCIGSIRVVFGSLVPFYAIILAVLIALVLSVMGVQALGTTDLNPVSGISKLAQLFFALIIPQSNKNSVLINLIAGAVSEAGALQAGDLMQDLKTGHILNASPRSQFWGQIIGSTVGAIVSALLYRLYTSVNEVPGELFQVPTAYVWIFTARLVTGKGLPYMALQWAAGAAVIFTTTTIIKIYGSGKRWHPYVPGGIAVAVGKSPISVNLTLINIWNSRQSDIH